MWKKIEFLCTTDRNHITNLHCKQGGIPPFTSWSLFFRASPWLAQTFPPTSDPKAQQSVPQLLQALLISYMQVSQHPARFLFRLLLSVFVKVLEGICFVKRPQTTCTSNKWGALWKFLFWILWSILIKHSYPRSTPGKLCKQIPFPAEAQLLASLGPSLVSTVSRRYWRYHSCSDVM